MAKPFQLRVKLTTTNRETIRRKNELNKARVRKYREKLKQNRRAYKNYKDKNREQAKAYRQKVAEKPTADLARKREYDRLRQQIYRLKKNQDKMESAPKTSKRVSKRKREKREKERVRQAEYRANNSAQKRRRLNERRRSSRTIQRSAKINKLNAKLNQKRPTPTNPTPTSVRKAKSRVNRVLPRSPRKWASVMNNIISRASPRKSRLLSSVTTNKPVTVENIASRLKVSAASVSRKILRRAKLYRSKRRDRMPDTWTLKISKFFLDDENTRVDPSKKSVSKKGITKEKRVLKDTLGRLYLKFKRENQMFSYGYTLFRRAMPSGIRKPKKNDQPVAVCVYHSNMQKKIEGLNNFLVKHDKKHLVISNTNSLVKKTSCDNFTAECAEGKCASCSTEDIKNHLEEIGTDTNESVLWKQWTQVPVKQKRPNGQTVEKKRWILDVKTAPYQEFLEQFIDALKFFRGHVYRASHQYDALKQNRTNLPANEIITWMDFAENYSIRYEDEIMSHHWSQQQVTLHPVVIYLRKTADEDVTIENLCFVSDDINHDTAFVQLVTQKTLSFINRTYPDMTPKHLHRWSDQCACQYKSKKTLRDLKLFKCEHGLEATFNFFETSEGKGACDGVGATTKHGLDNLVLHEKVALKNAYEVYLLAQQRLSSKTRTYIFLPQAEVAKYRSQYSIKPVIKPVAGIRNMHSATSSGAEGMCLKTRSLSCYCVSCLNHKECLTVKWNNVQLKPLVPDDWRDVDSVSSPVQSCDDQNQNILESDQNQNFPEPAKPVKAGDFVIIALETTNRHKRSTQNFVVEVLRVEGNGIEVAYLTKALNGLYKMPTYHDNSWELLKCVVKVLGPPTLSSSSTRSRQYYTFE